MLLRNVVDTLNHKKMKYNTKDSEAVVEKFVLLMALGFIVKKFLADIHVPIMMEMIYISQWMAVYLALALEFWKIIEEISSNAEQKLENRQKDNV